MQKAPLSYKSAFGRVIPLVLVCILLSLLLISVANDIYAFVKPEGEVSFVLGEPVSEWELCERLYRAGVIERRISFYAYLHKGGYSQRLSSLTGEWTLRTNMSYRELASEIF